MKNEIENRTLQKELPGLCGFSASNIKNMRQFYEQWHMLTNRQPMAGDLQSADDEAVIKTDQFLTVIRPPMAGDLHLIFNEAKED